jgi:hypothetical protein
MLRRSARLLFLPSLVVVVCAGVLAGAFWPVHANLQSSQDFAASSVPIYINDFELFSSATAPPNSSNSNSSKKPGEKGTPAQVFDATDVPSMQARRLMDFFTTTLLENFKKNGYTAALRQGHAQEEKGALISGVFAEPDAKNRIRRAMLGAGAPGVTMFLYVGTFNLARPSQPLYLPATEQNADSRYGPIITINNYIPMAKFELSKSPTEKEVQEISIQIVRNVSNLLQANAAAFAQ